MADPAAIKPIIVPLVKEVGVSVAASIKHQVNYLHGFSNNIASLEKEAENLQDTAADLQRKVDIAKDDLRVISDEVKIWLRDSKVIKDEIDEILKEVPNVGTGCFKLRARFYLSKRAKKITDLLKELLDKCNFADSISQPPPPVSTVAVPLETTSEFESTKQIEEDIMQTLRLGEVNMMGICGMGGLGKTIMAKRVMNRVLEENAIDEVVMVVVGQTADKLRVQLEIGGSLGLKMLEEETWQTRAQKLYDRLSGPERILVVFDDVWERLVLEDLGIPTHHKGCTILLTSRNFDVLMAMNVKKVFRMTVLSKEDAWFLFRERAGTCVDDTKLNSIAKEVVNECKGLPIALTIVSAALRNETNVDIWKDALRQLRQVDPHIPTLIANVYTPLKLSYDALGPKNKSVFLLCCLYPEDDDIPLDHLTYYCMGLGIFEGGMKEARNKMWAMANMLKRRSLLLDGRRGEEYVRMHDVVRDVCISIATQERYIGGNDCSWISLTPNLELSEEMGYPNLRLLLWIGDSANKEFNSRFLERVRDLRVLSIKEDDFISLPLTTQSLKKLKTLVINSCGRLEALFGVGKLENLEILVCRNCDSIKELPPEMKGLNKLKVLDLTSCYRLRRIGPGIISSLVGLEELKMLDSFKKWEGEDREERENAALRELEALTNLRCLEIEIEAALTAENMLLSSKLEKYDIRFSVMDYLYSSYPCDKKMNLLLGEGSCVGDWIEMQLLRDTECLHLEGNGANKVDLIKLKNIRFLELGGSESMKKILTSSMDDRYGATVLSQISLSFFQNLKELRLFDLPALKQVWECSSGGMDYLPQLEVLHIDSCEMMEQVFMWDGEDENENGIQSPNSHPITTKILPKLIVLYLRHLPNLTSFYQGIENIEFPQLTTLDIEGCSKMKIMVSKEKESNVNNSGGSSDSNSWKPPEMSFTCLKELSTDWNPFCDYQIDVSLFNGLEKLTIERYRGSISFITPSIAKNLLNLKGLSIKWCDEMVRVIEDDEETLVSGGQRTLLFPKLQSVRLRYLRKLVSFCDGKCDVVLPSLRRLHISNCNNMKIFTLGLLEAPYLKSVHIDSNVNLREDLNEKLQRHYYTPAKVLREENAWLLFREGAGMCVDDIKLNYIAKEVVNECKGLRIALTTVSAALRDETNVDIWKDALGQLRQSDPNIPAMIADVYNPLKLSYDVLDVKHKYVFLLCCLYPEDSNIPLERLTYYCMGLGIFEGGIEEARNRMRALATMFKSRCLLLASEDGDEYVRMLNVVRHVCIFIAKQEGYIGGNDCRWISSTRRFELPKELEFPNLNLLMWTHNSANEKFGLDSRFLERVRDLHVLSIENDDLLTSLPLGTQSLKNIKTLVLDSCRRLGALSGVGELVNLEILICHGCYSIEELPPELKGLNQLKVLDLSQCESLERIERGIISSLVGLEELKMLGSFKKWEAEDTGERENAALREVQALTNLRCLEIEIQDAALAAEDMRLSSKIDKLDIRFSSFSYELYKFDKEMRLSLGEKSSIGHLIEMQLLRDTECLLLKENGANEIEMAKLENIRNLELGLSESMKKIVIPWMDDYGGGMDDYGGGTVLSRIGHLRLGELPKLEKIWGGRQISWNSFQNLKDLRLHYLPALKQLWVSSSRGTDYLLPQLEVLSIVRCEMMERVIMWEGVDENEENIIQSPKSHHITTKILPKLQKLKLIDLSSLTSFYQGIQGIEFPQLRRLKIARCNKLKIMVSKGKESNGINSGGSSSNSDADIHNLHCQPEEMSFGCLKELSTNSNPFCGRKIDILSLFNGLEELTIADHEGSMSFITPSIAKNLVNLKVLRIQWCEKMVKVFKDDEEKLVSGGQRTLLFPKLETLELRYLRKLESFCELDCDVELRSLRELNIRWCDNMKKFTSGLLYTPKLESVSVISDDDLEVEKDWKKMLLESVCVDDALGVVKDWDKMLQQLNANRAKEEKEKCAGVEEREGEIEDEPNS